MLRLRAIGRLFCVCAPLRCVQCCCCSRVRGAQAVAGIGDSTTSKAIAEEAKDVSDSVAALLKAGKKAKTSAELSGKVEDVAQVHAVCVW